MLTIPINFKSLHLCVFLTYAFFSVKLHLLNFQSHPAPCLSYFGEPSAGKCSFNMLSQLPDLLIITALWHGSCLLTSCIILLGWK